MSGHPGDNPRWVLIEPDVLAKLEGASVTGLLIYGEITAERLRAVRLSRLDHIAGTPAESPPPSADGSRPLVARFPEWEGESPPTPADVNQAQAELRRVKVGRLVPTGNWRMPGKLRSLVIEATTRREGEPASDFYRRFGQMFQDVSLETPSPNQAIAEVTGLSTNVVKQYVHRARSHGFLPPSRRGTR